MTTKADKVIGVDPFELIGTTKDKVDVYAKNIPHIGCVIGLDQDLVYLPGVDSAALRGAESIKTIAKIGKLKIRVCEIVNQGLIVAFGTKAIYAKAAHLASIDRTQPLLTVHKSPDTCDILAMHLRGAGVVLFSGKGIAYLPGRSTSETGVDGSVTIR